MARNGADIRHIQAILGHSQLSTTEIYTHLAIGKLRAVHALTHPAEHAAPGNAGPSPPESGRAPAEARRSPERGREHPAPGGER